MNAIPWLAKMDDLTGFEWSFLILAIIIGIFATGFILDLIMRQAGMGALLNGVIAFLGACAGIWLRYRFFSGVRVDELALTIGFAIVTPILVLLTLSLAKKAV